MSESMTNITPSQGLNNIEYQIDYWNSTKLWEQMTEDHFWTAVYIKGMNPDSTLRTDVINKVNEFINKRQRDREEAIADNDEHKLVKMNMEKCLYSSICQSAYRKRVT
jgi:hypothetical protein